MTPTCCNTESKWVENVTGKGYFFCDTCRHEVITPGVAPVKLMTEKELGEVWEQLTFEGFVSGVI